MTTPDNSEGIIHANWPDNMVPVAIRVKKYDQWRYNVLGMALYGKELYLIEILLHIKDVLVKLYAISQIKIF